MAYEKIADLEQKVIADAIVADINKLPEESQITSSSQAQIDSLLSRVEALGEDTSAITNLAKLQAAKTKVDAVIAQREALNDLIKSTLDGVTITLKNKSLIDAVDKLSLIHILYVFGEKVIRKVERVKIKYGIYR